MLPDADVQHSGALVPQVDLDPRLGGFAFYGPNQRDPRSAIRRPVRVHSAVRTLSIKAPTCSTTLC